MTFILDLVYSWGKLKRPGVLIQQEFCVKFNQPVFENQNGDACRSLSSLILWPGFYFHSFIYWLCDLRHVIYTLLSLNLLIFILWRTSSLSWIKWDIVYKTAQCSAHVKRCSINGSHYYLLSSLDCWKD